MKKRDRQAIIKELIASQTIETQEELLRLLEVQGIEATQATISRDIRELKVIKARNTEGKTYYHLYQDATIDSDAHLIEMIQEIVTKVERVQFMTIVHTTTGSADLIAALLDEMKSTDIVATMAGTDTLLVISPDGYAANKVFDKIQGIIDK